MRLVAGVLHITGVASNCYAGDKMVCMQINTNQKLVNVQVIRVNNDTTIDPGAFKDFTVTFTEHSGIIPITALRGTGWWCGGVEVQKVTKNSLTIRFLSPLTNHSLKGGYADYVLFFLK